MAPIQFGYKLWSTFHRRNKREALGITLNFTPASRMFESATEQKATPFKSR